MNKTVKIIARLKYLFDLGMAPMAIVQFSVMVIAASPVLRTLIPISVTALVIVSVVLAIVSILLLGWFSDKIGFARAYQEEQNQRNEMLKGIHYKTENKGKI
jgi:hypothetical protein